MSEKKKIEWAQVWRNNGADEIIKTETSCGKGYHIFPDSMIGCQGVFQTLEEAKQWFEEYYKAQGWEP